MAFVNEKYPQSEKAKIDTLVANRPKYSRPPGSSRWTVDRERDAFLVIVGKEGGTYEGTQETEHYVLSWKGERIHFSGDPVLSGKAKSDMVMSWLVHQVIIPPAIENQKSEVLQLIREALDAKGWLYDRDRLSTVEVNFAPISSR